MLSSLHYRGEVSVHTVMETNKHFPDMKANVRSNRTLKSAQLPCVPQRWRPNQTQQLNSVHVLMKCRSWIFRIRLDSLEAQLCLNFKFTIQSSIVP